MDKRSIDALAERISWNMSWKNGNQAAKDGRPATDNPHHKECSEWHAWQCGWMTAAQKIDEEGKLG